MKYVSTIQTVKMMNDGIEGVSEADILVETEKLKEAWDEIYWRYLEQDLIEPKDMQIGEEYVCLALEIRDEDNEIIDHEELYRRTL